MPLKSFLLSGKQEVDSFYGLLKQVKLNNFEFTVNLSVSISVLSIKYMKCIEKISFYLTCLLVPPFKFCVVLENR